MRALKFYTAGPPARAHAGDGFRAAMRSPVRQWINGTAEIET
jgi:hypothetical protein